MGIGIEDVARRAGVSIATVSRALRGLPNVSPETRAKVQQAADELGYQADPNAARLASGRTNTLGIVVPALDSWFFGKVAAGATVVLAEAGHDLMVFTAAPGREADAFVSRPDLRKHVAGLLLVNLPLGPAARRGLQENDLPAVAVGAASAISPAVCIDEHEVGRMAVQHLVDLGHERIGLIGDVGGEELNYRVPTWRREAWIDVLDRAGLPHGDDLFASGHFTVSGGRQAARQLLDRPDRPTALFAMSDEMAIGAIRACRDLGLDVPQDVSIIGVDDHDVAEAVGLTTIHQDPLEQGEMAARLLVDLVAGRTADGRPGDVLLVPTLRERLTTRTLSARHRAQDQRSQ